MEGCPAGSRRQPLGQAWMFGVPPTQSPSELPSLEQVSVVSPVNSPQPPPPLELELPELDPELLPLELDVLLPELELVPPLELEVLLPPELELLLLPPPLDVEPPPELLLPVLDPEPPPLPEPPELPLPPELLPNPPTEESPDEQPVATRNVTSSVIPA
jgi:hypothetical protein